MARKNEPLYHLVVFTKAGKKNYLTSEPVTAKEAATIRSKLLPRTAPHVKLEHAKGPRGRDPDGFEVIEIDVGKGTVTRSRPARRNPRHRRKKNPAWLVPVAVAGGAIVLGTAITIALRRYQRTRVAAQPITQPIVDTGDDFLV